MKALCQGLAEVVMAKCLYGLGSCLLPLIHQAADSCMNCAAFQGGLRQASGPEQVCNHLACRCTYPFTMGTCNLVEAHRQTDMHSSACGLPVEEQLPCLSGFPFF